jgi:hypothetical protein
MSLLKVLEERKQLGHGRKRGPRTLTMGLVLVIVVLLILYLDRIG